MSTLFSLFETGAHLFEAAEDREINYIPPRDGWRDGEDRIVLQDGTVFRKLTIDWRTDTTFDPQRTDSRVTILSHEPKEGDRYRYSEWSSLIKCGDGSVYYEYADYKDVYYCREDRYDAIQSQIENGAQFDRYCYFYYLNNDSGKLSIAFLSTEQMSAVDTVLKTVVPKTADLYLRNIRGVHLTHTTHDLLFFSGAELFVYAQDDALYVLDNNGETQKCYTVPNGSLKTELEKLTNELAKTSSRSVEYTG